MYIKTPFWPINNCDTAFVVVNKALKVLMLFLSLGFVVEAVYVLVNSKALIPTPGQTPREFDFGQIFLNIRSLQGQMPQCQGCKSHYPLRN